MLKPPLQLISIAVIPKRNYGPSMSELKAQDLKNHARLDPAYHVVGTIFLLFLLVLSIVLLVQNIHGALLTYVFLVVLSCALFLIFFKTRAYPAKVQDRVIRLEERLRLSLLLPDPLRQRIPELTEAQLIGLRFASDAEVPKLVKEALDQQLTRKQIKERIQNWRPDHFRI